MFLWFILFPIIVAIIGGVLQANHNAKKERSQANKKLDELRNYTTKVNGVTYHRNILDNPVTDIELNESKRCLDEVKAQNRVWEDRFKKLGELSAKGNALGKSGQISSAIKAYEAAVEYGETTPGLNFPHYARDIDRLVILYRKQKEYQSEIAILRRALSNDMHPNNRASYEQRLNKATELLNKQK